MVTSEEIARIPLFSGLDEQQRLRLSRAAADISLVAGEYAADEGSDRALFAVLEGRIEPVKHSDGIARVVGVRNPGDVFGEVPITLGTVFPSASAPRSRRASCGWSRATSTRSPPTCPTSRRRSGGLPRTGCRACAGCRASRPTRRRRARSSSATAGTRSAPSCAAS